MSLLSVDSPLLCFSCRWDRRCLDHRRVFDCHCHGAGHRILCRLHAISEFPRPQKEARQDKRNAQRQDPVIHAHVFVLCIGVCNIIVILT